MPTSMEPTSTGAIIAWTVFKALTMSSEASTGSQKMADAHDLTADEYRSLRDEIVKRIEIQHQLLSLALIAPGTVLAIGFQTRNASLMLLYPMLGMFLSAVWLANSFAIHDISAYIQSQILPRVGEDSSVWERFRAISDTRHLSILHFWGTRGLFIGTELLALLAGITLAKFDTAQTIFLIIGTVSSVLTIIMLSMPQMKRHNEQIR